MTIVDFIGRKSVLLILLFLVLGCVSFFPAADHFSKPESYKNTINTLDEKKITVAELTAASTGASAAITLLPGDAGTPLAEKLMDMSGYFILILSAIYLEKMLTVMAGQIAFRYIFPIACALMIGYIVLKKEQLRLIAFRITCFGLILFVLVPFSVRISKMVESTQEASVQATIDDANSATDEVEENSDSEDESVLNKFLDKVDGGISGQLEKFEKLLSDFIDSVAMLIVTTCVIPIAVLVILLSLVKQVLGSMNIFFIACK